MEIPIAMEEYALKRLLPIWKTALEYCALAALEENAPGSLGYDAKADEVIYHRKVTDMDAAVCDILHGADEIWIITGGGQES